MARLRFNLHGWGGAVKGGGPGSVIRRHGVRRFDTSVVGAYGRTPVGVDYMQPKTFDHTQSRVETFHRHMCVSAQGWRR